MFQSKKVKRKHTQNLPDYSKENLENPLLPYGLGSVMNDYHIKHRDMDSLIFGVEDEADVEEKFQRMQARVSGSGIVVKDKATGEEKELKNRSRWNEEYNYGMHVKGKFIDQVKGLRHVSMLALTLDQKLVAQLIPDWWTLGMQEFVILHFNTWVSNFLHQLKMYRSRQGMNWHYVGHVVEFHDGKRNPSEKKYIQDLEETNKGLLHCHMIFMGNYIAPLKLLHSFWGLCQYQGIEYTNEKKWRSKNGKDFNKRLTGEDAVKYAVKYVSKTLNGFKDDPDLRKLAKWFWFFRRRMFNTRHKTARISGEAYELAGLFNRLNINGQLTKVTHKYEDEPDWKKHERRGREIRKWGMRLVALNEWDQGEWDSYKAALDEWMKESQIYAKANE